MTVYNIAEFFTVYNQSFDVLSVEKIREPVIEKPFQWRIKAALKRPLADPIFDAITTVHIGSEMMGQPLVLEQAQIDRTSTGIEVNMVIKESDAAVIYRLQHPEELQPAIQNAPMGDEETGKTGITEE